MKSTIYEYQSYRKYLKDRLEAEGPKSGLKRRAAESLRVHTTFISQIVLGKADLSLDQAERMNDFLRHSDEEGQFFLDLVILERSSDSRLRKRYEKKIQQKIIDRSQINKRLVNTRELDPMDQDKFYSSYLFGLLHVLASIPKFNTRQSLVAATGFQPKIVDEAIAFLLRIGVLKSSKDQLVPGEQHVHLGKDSKNIWRHHANWRMATLQHFEFGRPSDLHYSLTFSCSEQDAHKIRESLLAHLKSMTEMISTSKEENPYVYCFDFYQW